MNPKAGHERNQRGSRLPGYWDSQLIGQGFHFLEMAFNHRKTFGEVYVSLDPFRLTRVIDTVDSGVAFGISNGFQFGLYFGFEEIWIGESSDVDSDEDVAELLDIFESYQPPATEKWIDRANLI